MSLADVFAPVLAIQKEAVLRDTWGHLAPTATKKYRGYILFTLGDYGDITIIQARFKDLPDSPWLFEHMNEYIGKVIDRRFRRKLNCHGKVFRFDGTYRRFKNENASFGGTVRSVVLVTRRRTPYTGSEKRP